MKQAKPGSYWFFVDESGDPTFYDRKGNLIVDQDGCSPILVLGRKKITPLQLGPFTGRTA